MSFHGEGCAGGFVSGSNTPSTPAFSAGIPIVDHTGQLGEWSKIKPTTDDLQDDEPVERSASSR